MLAGGGVVELVRGEVLADESGRFLLERADGSGVEVQLPMHELPAVPKCSAGYRGGAGLDLIDLFVGSEGTLGVLLEVELGLARLDHETRAEALDDFILTAPQIKHIEAAAALREVGVQSRGPVGAAPARVTGERAVEEQPLTVA